MKIINLTFSFAVILLLIASCAPAQEAPKTESGAIAKTQTSIREKPAAAIAADVKDLLNRHNTKVGSIYYKYRGPETGSNFYEFYIKGNKIKYKPYLELKTLEQPKSYDSIFIDKAARTAQSYCTAAYCAYKGKKADLVYNDAYIATAFDWLDAISAEKVGEEVIDSRSTWKISTDKGILWIDTFYGMPLKAESGGKIYKFEQLGVNSAADEDVIPS